MIDSKEFSAVIFGRSASRPGTAVRAESPQRPGGGTLGWAHLDELVQKLRDKLATRGARGIIGLARQFKIMDDNRSQSLDEYEFTKGMKDYGLGFTNSEIKALFQAFDSNRNGEVEYNEFLRHIRGPMSPFRKKLVTQAFNKLDRDGSGRVDINDIKGVYDASNHPDVLDGKKTEE